MTANAGALAASGSGAANVSGLALYSGSLAAQGDAYAMLTPVCAYLAGPVLLAGAGSALAILSNAAPSRKRLTRTLLQVPASAPSWANSLVAQINALLGSTPAPTAPQPLFEVATASDLPPAASYPLCLAWVDSLACVAVSAGGAWLPLNPGTAAIA